jgi:signal transduction histidine kinase
MKNRKGHRIVWFIRGLISTGLLMVAISQGMIGWTLYHIRTERAQATSEQRQLNQASDQLRQLIANSRWQIQTSLDETTLAPSGNPAVPALAKFIRVLLNAHPDASLATPLMELDKEVSQLSDLSDRGSAWRNSYEVVWSDISQQSSMGKVRTHITQLRNAVDALEGQHRLDDAIRYTQWRRATGDDANDRAEQILTDEGRKQSQSPVDFRNQLSELAALVEVLGGEEQFDNLADLKDNKLKPTLDRLSRSISIFSADPANGGAVTQQAVKDIYSALFGEGFVVDEAHQSIQPGQGGLFLLRRDVLQLRRQREALRRDVSAMFQNIEQSRSNFGQLAQDRTGTLAQEMEATVSSSWRRMWIWGGVCMAAFIWLAILISRGIYAQVDAIETARAEAESGRLVTQRLMQEQQVAAAELENVHKQLLDASRQAGMAEVATGVLHNVGNVLNSVNVSANVIRDKVGQSRTGNLAKASAMIESHRDDLAAYLTTDEKGRQLPGYFKILAKELGDENAAVLNELNNLARGIDHIKEVVQFQQDFAKSSTFCQLADPASLLEDALRINMLSLERHNVEIVRELENLGEINIDKHKVLQVLINLISNSKNAMKSAAGERKMVLRLSKIQQPSGEFVRFQVTDTGVGIDKESLPRIFTHGFTTRPTGHGFGLHTSANAAREMNGTLTASSDGIGNGATFSLEIPIAREKVQTP